MASLNSRVLIAAAGVVLLLSGCSATAVPSAPATSAASMDIASIASGGLAIGKEAVGFTGTASPAPTSSQPASPGWVGKISCPGNVESELRAALDKTTDGSVITLTKEDPKTISGPSADPQLTAGDVPTCALMMSTPVSTVQEQVLLFRGIPRSFVDAFEAKLVSDGFTAGASHKNGLVEQWTYSKGIQAVQLEYNPLTPTSSDGVISIIG